MNLIQNVVPLITLDSISSLVTSVVVISVGVFLARNFFKFKEDVIKMQLEIVTKLSEISTKLDNLDGEVDLLREYKHKIDSILTVTNLHTDQLSDHETRLRFIERPEVKK